MPKKIPVTQLHNPFAHMEARNLGKSKEELAAAEAVAKRAKQKADFERKEKEIKAKGRGSWMDTPFNVMRSVGDYMRGVNRR